MCHRIHLSHHAIPLLVLATLIVVTLQSKQLLYALILQLPCARTCLAVAECLFVYKFCLNTVFGLLGTYTQAEGLIFLYVQASNSCML